MSPLVLVAINAKYPHTNLAVRSISAYAGASGAGALPFVEYTVNQRPDLILSRLYELDCAAYLFSCYIWNIELVRDLARDLRLLRPEAGIWAGGPEVAFDSERFLRQNPAFDLVVRGEGEETVAMLLCQLQNNAEIGGLPGVSHRQGNRILHTPDAPPPDLSALPFPYGDLEALTGRVIYYESMRGCPYRCAYCVSSIEQGVRARDLSLVFDDLRRFLKAQVPRVKFVDRTFNCNRKRALEIWRFLAREDNGLTNFHFELSGELLDRVTLEFLSTLRPGLFQFEIGVQSANRQTLRTINRACDLDRLFDNLEQLRKPGNIHLHLDLIAGLPGEGLASFADSFDRVYRLRPHQLQLGFLKVLPGSAMRREAEEHGILYRERAPYEVLRTAHLTFGELRLLKGVEAMVELYYNSGRFEHLMGHIRAQYASPFALYLALWQHWQALGHEDAPSDKTGHYAFLGSFLKAQKLPCGPREEWLCRLDLLLHDRPRKVPDWVTANGALSRREVIALPQDELAARHCHLERFPFQPLTGEERECLLLFDYRARDLSGHALVREIAGPDETSRA